MVDFLNSSSPVFLYGTTPPRLGASPAETETAAQKLVERTTNLRLDGFVVYDVQDESERNAAPRPFPFLPTLDSRVYSRLLREKSGKPVITYKSVAQMAPDVWQGWLDESAHEFGLETLSLVGAPTSRFRAPDSISLPQAVAMAKTHASGFTLGGVAIAERHSAARRESLRMIEKARGGCDFFVSQTVYHPQKTIDLLNDYARECRECGEQPRRVVLSFAPCGRAKTLEFIKWLGVAVPAPIESAILSAPDPLSQSVEICCAILREILREIEDPTLPLGLNIESVSIKKEEIDASITLFETLQAEFLRLSAEKATKPL